MCTTTTAPAATKTWTRRIIWSCKCGLVRAHDYTATARLTRFDAARVLATYSEPVLTREVDGRIRDVSWDAKCPCGRQRKSATVKGVRSAHVCDARCEAATGGHCECSCGGKNHGKAHMG